MSKPPKILDLVHRNIRSKHLLHTNGRSYYLPDKAIKKAVRISGITKKHQQLYFSSQFHNTFKALIRRWILYSNHSEIVGAYGCKHHQNLYKCT